MLELNVDAPPKHTFKDDMESLLYIVLYCALLYQPHGLTQEELTDIVSEVFDLQQRLGSIIFGEIGRAHV